MRISNKTKQDISMYLCYTIFFSIAAVLVFWHFKYYGKSMVWQVDGLYQHYNAFVYLGEWCRDIINNLIYEQELIVPLWEWGLGLGSDVITTLSYYVFGDPFALVSIFFPVEVAEQGYALSIIIRFFVSGVTFCVYSRKMKCERWCAVVAAILYAFCAFSVHSGVRHPYFINPMIYFPLILLGVEKVFRKESPIVLILSVFVAAISNFYFFYMLVIFTVLYVLVRLLSVKEKRVLKDICQQLFKIGVFAFIGVLLSAVLFLPNVMAFLGNTRVNDAYEFEWLYTLAEYEKFIGSFIGNDAAMPWAFVGMAPIAYLATGVSFIQRKKENLWAIWFVVLQIIFLLFPVFGHIFNGFGYVSNRWVFIWAFSISFLFAKKLPELLNLTTKEKGYLSVWYGFYAVVCISLEKSRREDVLVGVVSLLVSLAFVWCAPFIKNKSFKKVEISGKLVKQAAVLLLVFTFIQQIGYQRYSHLEGDYLEEFHDLTTANKQLYEEGFSLVGDIDDKDFYRIENITVSNPLRNYPANEGKSSSMAYWSLVNPNVINFIELNNAYEKQAHCNKGFQSRSLLLPLLSAKYFVATDTNVNKYETLIPFSYEYIKETTIETVDFEDKSYYLYKTANTLPFGFTYDEFITEEKYKKMSIAERQQSTLQAAVVEEPLEDLKVNKTTFTDQKLDYTITQNQNIDIVNNIYTVKERNSRLILKCDVPENCELYVYLSGVGFESINEYDLKDEEFFEKLTQYDKVKIEHSKKYWQPATATTFTCKGGNVSSTAIHFTENNKYATGRQNYLINLGYEEETRDRVTISFEEIGEYRFNKIILIAQPMDNFYENIRKLSEDSLTNVKMSSNKITGKINLAEKKLLCLSLPYSEGWKCYVDGEEVETIKTNIMQTGVMLNPGFHNIELIYRTPYLLEGALLSLIGVLGTVAICVVYVVTKKKQKNKR